MAQPDRLAFNHAMIYTRRMAASLHFYRDILGFELIEQLGDGYSRLRSPGSDTTIALHSAGDGVHAGRGGIRQYFEVADLGTTCSLLEKKGALLKQMPRLMEWGWRHACLADPDGNDISIYTAGQLRL